MNDATLKATSAIQKYSVGIQNLSNDIINDINNNILDGVAMKISRMNCSKEEIFSFLKDEGYDIQYSDFQIYYKDSINAMSENEKELTKIVAESYDEELNEGQLENIAGGKINWKKVGAIAGTALIVGGLVVATGGVGAIAISLAAGASTTVVAGGLSAIVVGGVAAGTGAGIEYFKTL